MSEKWKEEDWAQDFWYSGKVSRRRVVGWGGGAIGALMLVPAPWRAAFGQAKPYKVGAINPLSGATIDNLFSSHPATENRIAALQQLATELGTGGAPTVAAQRYPSRGPWGRPSNPRGPWG